MGVALENHIARDTMMLTEGGNFCLQSENSLPSHWPLCWGSMDGSLVEKKSWEITLWLSLGMRLETSFRVRAMRGVKMDECKLGDTKLEWTKRRGSRAGCPSLWSLQAGSGGHTSVCDAGSKWEPILCWKRAKTSDGCRLAVRRHTHCKWSAPQGMPRDAANQMEVKITLLTHVRSGNLGYK